MSEDDRKEIELYRKAARYKITLDGDRLCGFDFSNWNLDDLEKARKFSQKALNRKCNEILAEKGLGGSPTGDDDHG